LNGVCPSWCSGVKFPDPKPYGVNLPGGTFKFTLNDLSGTAHVAQGVQLQQSGYLALQTPYVMFGLGRTSNYIEEIFMGVPISNGKEHYNSWICIIPNSQVIGFPYPPSSPAE
jgi:integrin alpha FG-GAP repeat containing protein 1